MGPESDVPVPREYESEMYENKQRRLEMNKANAIIVNNIEFYEGMICLRKGKECEIKTIDRAIDPPACTVKMLEAGNIVGTELHLLQALGGADEKMMEVEEEEQKKEEKKPIAVVEEEKPKPIAVVEEKQQIKPVAEE